MAAWWLEVSSSSSSWLLFPACPLPCPGGLSMYVCVHYYICTMYTAVDNGGEDHHIERCDICISPETRHHNWFSSSQAHMRHQKKSQTPEPLLPQLWKTLGSRVPWDAIIQGRSQIPAAHSTTSIAKILYISRKTNARQQSITNPCHLLPEAFQTRSGHTLAGTGSAIITLARLLSIQSMNFVTTESDHHQATASCPLHRYLHLQPSTFLVGYDQVPT